MIIELCSFQTKMGASCNRSTVVDKVSTGPCHQQNFRHDSRGLHKYDQKKFHSVEHHLCSH